MYKDQKIEELIAHLAAEFFSRESNRTSLITVTRAAISDKLTTATILFTVLPESKEHEALEFMKRNATEFRDYLKEHSKMRKLPFINFEIDVGEKNRQRIDIISAT